MAALKVSWALVPCGTLTVQTSSNAAERLRAFPAAGKSCSAINLEILRGMRRNSAWTIGLLSPVHTAPKINHAKQV